MPRATRDDLRRLVRDLESLATRAAACDCKALAIILACAYRAAADGTLDELADLLAVRHMMATTQDAERN